jgi:TRAP-type C4-dicarboxylate transport system permease small subunit
MKYSAVRKSCATVRGTLQKGETFLGSLCLGTMLAMMLLNIFFRYILSKPIFFSDELSNYLFIWMSFLSAAFVMGNDGHVRVTTVVSHFPEKVQIVIKMVMDMVMVIVFAMYVGPSIRMLGRLKLSNMMRIPLKFVYVIMPIAFLLMCIHIVVNCIDEFARLQELKGSAEKANGGT